MPIKRDRPILLFFPLDMLSHVLRCLQLADAVKGTADCIIATEKFGSYVTGRGFKAIHYKALSADMVIQMGQRGDYSYISKTSLEPILLHQVQVIKAVKPDYVINDMTFTAHLAAEIAGTPCISLVNGFMSRRLAIQRPVPPSNPLAKFAFLLPRFLINRIERLVLWNLHRPYRVLRGKYGLKQNRRTFFEEFEADINLILDPNEFAPQKNFDSNTFYLGSLYHVDDRSEDHILAALDPDKKTILVNLGSSGQIQRVQFLNHPDFAKFNIIVVGKSSGDLSGRHFIRAEFLSLESVLQKVDLVLTQAGTGNLFQSLAHGVPVLCFPTFFEQEWNAMRIEELGYGLSLTGRESHTELTNLINVWSEKKSTLKFKLVKGTISVSQTKARFRRVVAGLLGPRLRPSQIETAAPQSVDDIEREW